MTTVELFRICDDLARKIDKIENDVLRDWANKFGFVNLAQNLNYLFHPPFSLYLGNEKIDRTFYNNLSENDKNILSCFLDFANKKN